MSAHAKYIKVYFLMMAFAVIGAVNLFAGQPWFKVITLPQSMSDCRINHIEQDSDGLLVYYDGYDFVLSDYFDEPVTYIAPGNNGQLIITCESGKTGLLKSSSGYFEILELYSGSGQLTATVQTKDEAMWLAIYGEGIYRFADGESQFINSSNSALTDEYFYRLLPDTLGRIWAATDGGIQIIDYQNDSFQVSRLHYTDGLPDIMVVSLSAADDNHLFAGGYEGGFSLIYQPTAKIQWTTKGELWSHGAVTGVVQNGNRFWVATQTNGLVRLDHQRKGHRQFTRFDGLEITEFQQIFHDLEGNIWAVAANAIVMIQAAGFEFFRHDSANVMRNIHALMFDTKDYLWYATEKGLFRQDIAMDRNNPVSAIQLPENIQPKNITCLHRDEAGRIWIGTFGNGLLVIDEKDKPPAVYTQKNGFVNDNILSIASNGNFVWFATLGGAARTPVTNNLQKPAFEIFNEREGPGNKFIYSVITDSRRRVWFATDGTGIIMLQDGRFKRYGIESGLSSEKIYTMAEDENGTVWCATHDNKVFYFSENKFHEATTGLDGRYSIFALHPDTAGNLLIVHENGVSIYNPADSSALHYGSNYGIQPIRPEFNSTASGHEGIIWIGANDHLMAYSPPANRFVKNPQPLITGVQVLSRKIYPKSDSYFDYNENYLTLHFAGLWYQNPKAVLYRVKLVGNDLQWNYTSDRRVAYSRLTPGDYTFLVEASLNDDFRNANSTQYTFTIGRPLWQKWWVITTALAAVGLLIYFFFRLRMERIRRMEALEKEKLLFQFETLRSQVNPHFLFNSFSTLMSIIEEDKKMAQDYVEKLSAFFRNILEYRDQNLITLGEELKIARNYLHLQQQRYGKNLIVKMQIEASYHKALTPPLTLQLLLENAIKHNIISNAKPLTIKVFVKNNRLIVENNLQPKNYTGESTGFGLKTIKQRYNYISEEQVEILQQQGIFRIILPLIFET